MKKIAGLILGVVLLAVTGLIGVLTGYFKDLLSWTIHIDFGRILTAIAAVLALWVIEQLISLILKAIKTKNHRAKTLIMVTVSVLKYVFIIIAVCAILAVFGADIRTVIAGVGILTLVVGFGAESLIADLMTGMFSIIENQYNVGDIIEVNGFRGTVTNIGIRTTSLIDAGGNVLIINNSDMKNILNRSDNASKAVCEIDIPYETDIEAFEAMLPDMMKEIYSKHCDKMKRAPVYLGISTLGDSAIRLKFCVEVEEADVYTVQRILNRELLVAFRKVNVEIPYPQLDVHQR